MIAVAIEIRVCFKNRLKNTYVTIATDDIDEAKRVARIWGATTEREPVTRTIFKQHISAPRGPSESVDGIKVWVPLF